jgi:hypothetical protein
MTLGGDPLKTFKTAVFDGGQSPTRHYLKFFHEAMRWPVDSFSTRTEVDHDQQFQRHHLVWLKGRLIGAALYVPGGDPEVTASVHPLHRVSRIELGAHVYDKGFEQANELSMTVFFDDGDQISVDPGGMAIEWQRERTGSFINAVLDAVGLATAEQ